MKKLFYSAAIMALAFFAGSCQQENLEPVGGNTVTYTVQVPDALATKALGDDITNINVLHYEVYRTEVANTVTFTAADNLLYHKTATMTNGVATINLELVNDQNYTVLFWAQVGETNEAYDVTDLTNVIVKSPLKANQESYAAFSGVDFIVEGKDLAGRTVTLQRPISQINIATTQESLTGNGAFDDDVVLEGSSVTVAGLSNSFNVATQEPGAEMTTTYEFAKQAVPAQTLKVDGKDYTYVAMNYVGFADAVGTNVKVSYVINTSEGDIDNDIENVPVKPNYRTNIVGNLITATSDYTVTLNDKWEGVAKEYEIWDGKTKNEPDVVNGKYIIRKASEFAWLEAPRVLEYDVVLASNIDMGGNKFQGILSNGKMFDGAGHTLKNVKLDYTTSQDWSSLFVTGGGSVGSSNINVKDLTVDGAYVVADKAGDGNAAVIASYAEATLNIENVKVKNSTVNGTQSIGALVGHVTASGDATIKNCEIDNVTLSTFDVPGESGNIGGVVGRVTGKCTIENTSISNSVINANVNDGNMTDQKRTVSKYIGNFYGSSASLKVTDGSINNVTLNLLNDLAQIQSCLYTEYLGGWRKDGGSVSINGIEITKNQTNEDITIDTSAELATAISNAADGAVIPVSGEIPTSSLSASGKSITIVGMSDDATINSASARMETYGNITFQNVTIKLPTNNDYYGGQDAHNAQIVYDNCKFVGTATAINGTFVYNDCEFTNPDKYAAWVYNGNVTYNNCSFTGKDRAAKVYAEAGNAPVVTYNNCTFNAAQSVNKTAVEIDCTNQTSGTPYYVTIINPTINNMGVAEHYAVGADGVCNLETSGNGLGIVNLDGKGYSVAHTAAQLQALTNAGKDVTIELAQDITGDFTYTQDNNENVVIDGKNHQMTGTVNVQAASDYNSTSTMFVIKNLNFTTTDDERDFINAGASNNYPHLTVSNCTFVGSGADKKVVPVRLKDSNYCVIEDCTASYIHSFINNTAGWNLTIRNCEVTNAGRGISLGSCQGVLIENVEIQASDDKYGIRMDANTYNGPVTIKDCEVSAFIPVVVRSANAPDYKLTFDGTNTMTAANTDGLWCVIGTSEYEANGVMPTDATGAVTVTLNDAGLDASGVYGASNL